MFKSFTGNPTLMHDINRTGALDVIRRMGPISQSKIATILRLQPSTILRIVNGLLEDELVHPIGMEESGVKGGRRATLLQLNPKGAYAIGVDLHSSEILIVLLDLAGTLVGEIRKPCSSNSRTDDIIQNIINGIHELLNLHPGCQDRLTGIGVSFPGKVDTDQGFAIYASNFTYFKDVPLAQMLKDVFHIPVLVEHDMRVMAFGQQWFDGGSQNMLCLGFRSGIGLGIVMNGQLYRGSNQLAGDLGHIIVNPEGPLCNCGKYGCLEAISSERAILNKFKEYSLNKRDMQNAQEETSIRDVSLAVLEGKTEVLEIVVEAAVHIGKTLYDLVRIFDPEKIIVGGTIIASSSEFLSTIQTTFNNMHPTYADFVPEIVTAQFGERSIAIGAAAIMLSKSFQPNQT
jgi:N-acetylglucosamine repressor